MENKIMTKGKLVLIIVLITIISIDISYFVQYGNPFDAPPTGIHCIFAGLTGVMLAMAGCICAIAYIVENWNNKI